MIPVIRNIASPKTYVMAVMLGTAALTAGLTLKAHAQNPYYLQNDTLSLQSREKSAFKLDGINDINGVKKYFNDMMQEFMTENAWKGRTKGMNLVEYLKLESFCNYLFENQNDEISKWAKMKLEEMEYLKNSDYNKKTLEVDLKKSSEKVEKNEKLLKKLQKNNCAPPDFLSLLLHADDYQRMSDGNIQEQKYCERDIAYYKNLHKAELNNVLSSQSVKKLKSGQGKKVK